MSGEEELTIRDVPESDRQGLDGILQESFTGVYLRHARKTMSEVQYVRAAFSALQPVGLSMLKVLSERAGYVYYIAVSRARRRHGLGSKLLDDSLKLLGSLGVKEVYASVGGENVESNALFQGRGFRRTDYPGVSKKYGVFKAISMYRAMFVVPGEFLLVKDNLTLAES